MFHSLDDADFYSTQVTEARKHDMIPEGSIRFHIRQARYDSASTFRPNRFHSKARHLVGAVISRVLDETLRYHPGGEVYAGRHGRFHGACAPSSRGGKPFDFPPVGFGLPSVVR